MCRTDYPIANLAQDIGRDVHRKEARGKPSKNIWLSSVYSYTEREKKQAGTLRKEGNICEVSKAFKIYIPGHRHIKISRDMTINEEATLKKLRRCQLEEVYEEEPVNPRIAESMREVPRVAEPVREVITSPNEELLEDHDSRSRSSYVLMGISIYGSCLCAEQTIP